MGAIGYDEVCCVLYGPYRRPLSQGEAYDGLEEFRAPVALGKSEVLYDEEDILLLAVGSMVKTAEEVRSYLKKLGYSCSLVNARFVKPIDEEMLREMEGDHRLIVTMEENVRCGGFGMYVLQYLHEIGSSARVIQIALPDDYIEHGNVEILKKEAGIDAESIEKRILGEAIGMLSDARG